MNLPKEEIDRIIVDCDNELKSNTKIKFTFEKKWSDNFPKKAGVYAVFYKNELFYIGQTANLKERMMEVKRTYNHTFRKKLGKFLYPAALVSSGKFEKFIEEELDNHYKTNLEFTFKVVNFGRLEIEAMLMQCNDGLLNSIGKRGKTK
jgi:predicted GIY-YIG superfamily endonuclease